MNTASPHVLTEYLPDQIWLKEYPVRFAGCRFNARMTIIRLRDGCLWIHSPCPMDHITRTEIEALGPVSAIVAPGDYHHLHVRSAQAAFPNAAVYICPGVEKKNPTLSYTKIINDEPDPMWAQDFDQVHIQGNRLIQEVAFFHRPTATLILTDLIENYGDNTAEVGGLLKLWWQYVFKMWNRPKPAPEYQLGWKDKVLARNCLEQILCWDFKRIIIAHGDLIEDNAQKTARTAWHPILSGTVRQQKGSYYLPRKKKLLKELDFTLALMNNTLVDRYGETVARQMQQNVRAEYEALIPEIPFVSKRSRMLNLFLRITAQEVAVYKALSKLGKGPEEIWQLCHQALRLRTDAIKKWKKWIVRKLMFSGFVKNMMARRAQRHQLDHFGDFEIEYVDSNDGDFDLGVNYHQCGNYRFAIEHDSQEFAPYICMSDIALSEAMGWGLKRTQTLADGCAFCDFRMKQGATTEITSKTPEVQAVIKRIRAQELAD